MLIGFTLLLCVSFGVCLGQVFSLPPALLGGAVVAAVEQDNEHQLMATEQQLERKWLQHAEGQLSKLIHSDMSAEEVLHMLDDWTAEARGKHNKHKKLLKMLYPFLAAAVLAKVILLPLVLKWLTALSASSFVMGKIALAAAGILALKSTLSGGHHGKERLEIIHAAAPALKSYHGDLTSSGSSWLPISQPYIPVGLSKDGTFRVPDHKPFL